MRDFLHTTLSQKPPRGGIRFLVLFTRRICVKTCGENGFVQDLAIETGDWFGSPNFTERVEAEDLLGVVINTIESAFGLLKG